jgi:hypothetical protein
MISNALPPQWRKKPFWLFFENSQRHLALPQQVEHSAKIFRCKSAETFLEHHLIFSPQLILIGTDIDWVDPIELTQILNKKFSSPLLMFFDPSSKESHDKLVKRAYQSGILEMIDERKSEEDILESIRFALMVSEKALTR